MTNMFMRIAALSMFAAACVSARAGHWVFVSATRSLVNPSSVSDPSVTLSVPTVASAQITGNTGYIYGTGTYSLFGENDQMSKNVYSALPGINVYSAYGDSRYTMTYKWVLDGTNDTPPAVGTALGGNGYAVGQATLSQMQVAGGAITKTGGWDLTWTYYGATLNPPYQPFSGTMVTYPSSLGGTTITFKGATYYVWPRFIGGGNVSLDANGNTIIKIEAQNEQMIYMSTAVGWMNGNTTTYCIMADGAGMNCWIGCSQIGGIAVLPQ